MIALILTIALAGLVVYLITTFIPMPPMFKNVIYIIAGICLLFYLLQAFGVADLELPKYRHR